MRALVLLLGLAPVLAGMGAALPALPALSEHAHLFLLGGAVHVQARYFDGLGSTKFGFLQFQGDGGRQDDRIDPGAQCTEWHGTFTQVEVRAQPEDNVASSEYALSGQLAALPPDAPTSGGAAGFTFDALGGLGAFDGVLDVCDHPGSFGLVSFTGSPAPLLLVGQVGTPGLVHIEEAA
ncbi:MAG: hypothetical protein LC624_09385 [Halobacteriales archaeon]|nr:hypothetical protein [Halobacteriales archaeon]